VESAAADGMMEKWKGGRVLWLNCQMVLRLEGITDYCFTFVVEYFATLPALLHLLYSFYYIKSKKISSTNNPKLILFWGLSFLHSLPLPHFHRQSMF